MRFRATAPFLTSALLSAACGGTQVGEVTAPATSAPARTSNDLGLGLSQVVEISPASPTTGSNIIIRSAIRNRSNTAVALESRICELGYGGTLTLSWPPEVMKCAGFSMTGTLAPGDSVVTHDIMRVTSPPGSYTLRVQHALTPAAWAELPVRVLGR